MNLNEMLIYADIEHIHKIADTYNCEYNRHSKTDIVQAILYKVFGRETIDILLSELGENEYTFIQLLYLDTRNQYSLEDLTAKSKQAIDLNQDTTNPRELILSALKKGWVFRGVKKKDLFVYLVPADYKNKVINSIKNKLQLKLNSLASMDFYYDESKLLIADLFKFLKFTEKEQILLTNTGSIYKRQQQVIFQLFSIPEEPLNKQGWRFGYGRRYNEYPDRFSLIYDFAFFNKLIFEDENGYLHLTKAGKEWLDISDYTIEETKLFQFWIRLYKYPIPYLQVVIKLIDLVTYTKWVSLSSLEENLITWIADRYYEKKEQIFKDRIIKMLLHLGAINIGRINDQDYISMTESGHRWISGYSNFDVKEIIIENKKK